MRVIQRMLTRITQSTSSDELVVTGILPLRYEAQYYKVQDLLITKLYPKPKPRQEKEKREML